MRLTSELRSITRNTKHTMAAVAAAARNTTVRPFLVAPLRLRQCTRRNVHIKATPSTSSIDGPVDLSEQTQAIPKLSGAGPFPAGELQGGPSFLLGLCGGGN